MTDIQEPHWLDVTTFDDRYEVEMDARAEPGSTWQYRHRQRAFSGQHQFEWKPGQPQQD
jgi:hypothetical protein